MTDERWQRLDAAFAEAVALPPDERRERLAELRADDPELASELEALLAADAEAGDFLETPPPVPAELLARRPGDLAAGDRLGPYRILRELGRGGMGAVYLAERADGAYEQRVAIKVLRPGWEADDLAARFVAERQILASLEHPGIARLHDGGTAPDGRPYLVMEYVHGDPIVDWCDERGLTVEERLELFIRVCRAVGYAHRNLLVHRDLKASNILVTDAGQTKLLDFGIAKLLEESELPHGAPATRTGVHPMTPECASPEQVRGDPVTTASDVYQLGVLLYELLAGVRPYRIESRAPLEIERIVCETRPDPPSARVAELDDEPAEEEAAGKAPSRAGEIARRRSSRPGRLRSRLSGDLDTIVSVALRKEPERRYPSADQLADDLERFLADRPVAARADTWRYRASRFARRNRGAVAAAASVALLLVALAAVSVRYAVTTAEQSRAIAAERDRARTEAARAEQVTEFMVSLFESALPTGERRDTLSVRGVLDRAGERIDGALMDQPAVRASLLTAIGRIQYGLGDVDEGQARVREGLALRRELHDGPHPDLVESLHLLANQENTGFQFESADTLYREALELHRRLPGSDSLRTATMLQGWSATLRDLGRADTAVLLMREVVELRRQLQGEAHADYLHALQTLAYAHRGRGELDDAERLYREALAGQRALGPAARASLPETLDNLAYVLVQREEFAAAEPLYREAARIHGELYSEAHPTTLRYLSSISGVLADQGRFDEAEAVARRTLERAVAHYPDSSWQVGAEHARVGSILFRSGRHAAAAEAFRRELAIFAADLGPEHLWTAVARHSLGCALLFLGHSDQGRRHLERSLPILERNSRRATTLLNMEVLELLIERLRESGDPATAVRYEAIRELKV